MNNTELQKRVVSALISQYQFKTNGEWLQYGRCPSCNKKELFTHGINPVMLRCGRLGKCGHEMHVRDALPDLFVNFNKQYPADEKKNPNATANAYMELVRGLPMVKHKGSWKQGTFYSQKDNISTATVRFHLTDEVYMERFVETIWATNQDGDKVKRKQHFKGSHKGLYWAPYGMEISKDDEVWIVEACIDALSLWANGIKSVAMLSCGNFPTSLFDAHKDKNIRWFWALDNDAAGTKFTKKHHERLTDMGERSDAALPPYGNTKADWNDLHNNSKFTDKDILDYKYYGSLVLAKTPWDKAYKMYTRTRNYTFHFHFNKRTYFFELDASKYGKVKAQQLEETPNMPAEEIREIAAKAAGGALPIANCQTTFLYFMRNDITDESWYYARVDFPHKGKSEKATFTGSQLSSGSEFKKRLLSVGAGAVFAGTSMHLNHIIEQELFDLKTVQTVDYIGYSKDHEAWIFNKKAVSDGKVYELNNEDYYEISKTSVKSLCNSPALSIGEKDQYKTQWCKHFVTAFGNKGIITLAFWIGSLFAEQIRDKINQKSYPFLEVIGEPGSGKSTLIEFLWKLCGRADYEGFDPSKASLAGRTRNFSQVSNLPIVLIESDREDGAKGKAFDWDEMKTAFNGRASRSVGVKNSGNDTYEPPFRGSLIISQNAEVNASEAILSRIVHLKFDKSGHTPETKLAAEYLEKVPLESVSYFLIDVITQEKDILKHLVDQADFYQEQIQNNELIKTVRIAKNHGQIMALVDIACGFLKVSADTQQDVKSYLIDCAIAREKVICNEHPVITRFWDVYQYLEDTGCKINHTIKDGYIAINLNHFMARAGDYKQNVDEISDLKRHLKNSKKYKFVANDQQTRSCIFNNNTRCWIFKAPVEKGRN